MKNFKRSISRKIKRFLELFDRNYSKEYCFILLKIPSHKSSNCRLREKKGETIRYNKDLFYPSKSKRCGKITREACYNF